MLPELLLRCWHRLFREHINLFNVQASGINEYLAESIKNIMPRSIKETGTCTWKTSYARFVNMRLLQQSLIKIVICCLLFGKQNGDPMNCTIF